MPSEFSINVYSASLFADIFQKYHHIVATPCGFQSCPTLPIYRLQLSGLSVNGFIEREPGGCYTSLRVCNKDQATSGSSALAGDSDHYLPELCD